MRARTAPTSRPRSRARVGRAMPARAAPRAPRVARAPGASSRRRRVASRRADAKTTRRIVAAAGPTRDGDDADDARRPRARSWASTNDAKYARLTRDANKRRGDDDDDEEGFRAASAAARARATRRRDATTRGDATRARDAYWGEDEGLSGWARMMGEEVDARAVDGRIRRRDGGSETTRADSAKAATAYKRGTERPWEAARRARDARRAEREAVSYTHLTLPTILLV